VALEPAAPLPTLTAAPCCACRSDQDATSAPAFGLPPPQGIPFSDEGRHPFCLAYHYVRRYNLNCGGKSTHRVSLRWAVQPQLRGQEHPPIALPLREAPTGQLESPLGGPPGPAPSCTATASGKAAYQAPRPALYSQATGAPRPASPGRLAAASPAREQMLP
jgi:hypothetical protein